MRMMERAGTQKEEEEEDEEEEEEKKRERKEDEGKRSRYARLGLAREPDWDGLINNTLVTYRYYSYK